MSHAGPAFFLHPISINLYSVMHLPESNIAPHVLGFPNPAETRPSLLPKLALKPWIQPAPKGYLLLNASVIDAHRGVVLHDRAVKVVDGDIESVKVSGSHAQLEGLKREADQQGLVVADLMGFYLCPGLIDAHVHVTAVPGVATMGDLVKTPQELISLRTTYVLREMLHRGFTTCRDTGGATKVLADAIAEGLIDGPRLFQCGKALSQSGGHGDFTPGISGGAPGACCGGHSESLGRTVDGIPEVLRAAREELKAGADGLKVMVGGGVASETDAIESVQFLAEELQAITRTVNQMSGGKRMVTAHAYTVEAIRHAIDNGITGIEHGNLLDEPTAKLMAEKGVYLTPTLSCYGVMVRPPFENFLSENSKVKNAQVMRKGLEALALADKCGVTVCFGTDLLGSMSALQGEEFYVRSTVLPAATILRQATINPARMLRMEGKLGVIASGAHADMLVLSKNPLDDIRVLDRTEETLLAVMKGGRVYGSRLASLH